MWWKMRNEDVNKDDYKVFVSERKEELVSFAVRIWKGYGAAEEEKQKKKDEFDDKVIEEETDLFGKYFTETQVDEWADRLKEAYPEKAENNISNIRKWIKKGSYCSSSEGMLHCHLQLEMEGPESPTFDPVNASDFNQTLILLLSECLKRPGRRPGTNPDQV